VISNTAQIQNSLRIYLAMWKKDIDGSVLDSNGRVLFFEPAQFS
jgi:hypothetical protein